MGRFDFWTHGVNVVVEHPEKILSEQRWGRGAEFTQGEKTENWFDFPVPSATVLDDDRPVLLRHMRIRAHCNENAFLTYLAVHDGDSDRVWEEDLAPGDEDGLTGSIDHGLGVEDGTMDRVSGGLNLCVHVSFRTGSPAGTVRFFGVGGLYTT